ncbi:MAG: hypothetical protein VX641_00120 [Planctomycetota bacterium]|nr:hypothetical protein [Planctomycetota bacterium]
MNVASSRSERTADPRASAALLTIMLVMAGMTAGLIEHATTQAVQSAHRDCRLVEQGIHQATIRWAALSCEERSASATGSVEESRLVTDLAHLAGSERARERRLRNLPPPGLV